MTHLGCAGCRVRFTPAATPHATCPRCGGALSVLAPREAIGFSLASPPSLEWRPSEMSALARAMASTSGSAHLP